MLVVLRDPTFTSLYHRKTPVEISKITGLRYLIGHEIGYTGYVVLNMLPPLNSVYAILHITQNGANAGECVVRIMITVTRLQLLSNVVCMVHVYLQLSPWKNTSSDNRIYPRVRWSQTYHYGYTPNDKLQRFFMAVAIDTPDFDGPQGWRVFV